MSAYYTIQHDAPTARVRLKRAAAIDITNEINAHTAKSTRKMSIKF
jgi:hypothetical protein